MLKRMKLLGLFMGFLTVGNVQAEDYYSSGRAGEVQRVDDGTEFKVCADQDNLPYSNSKLEGFENKIAEVLAQDLNKKLAYTFWYDRMGFIRNTLSAKKCDVIMGTTSDYDALRTSKPYYRSGHVFVYKKDSGMKITGWDSPDLKKSAIGIVGQSPATIPLEAHGLMPNARPYRMQRDLNLPPSYLVDDLVAGEIDVAIMWGPIGGYYAKQSKVPLEVVPIPEYENVNVKGKEYWNISIGVRKADKERLALIQGALDRNQDKIKKILDDYGIPHVPVVEGDSIMKVYRKGIEVNRESRGDAIPKTE
ncbi:MAG: quinoprotein dehydrogenase-associated putative ABC transporter substrate-binding protein [Methylotenera sp.]|nr:quinoprotein dehydrogenase-associated putative ABC transporter substrate-binding protein [Methylotenera sp.]